MLGRPASYSSRRLGRARDVSWRNVSRAKGKVVSGVETIACWLGSRKCCPALPGFVVGRGGWWW